MMSYRRIYRRAVNARQQIHFIESLERRQLLANILAFTAQPITTNAGSLIDSPAGVQVTVETSAGLPITTSTDSITVSISTNPGGAALGGTITANAVNGVATFANVTISTPINGYRLTAIDNTAASTASATSQLFNVDAIPTVTQLASLPAAGSFGVGADSTLLLDSSGNLFGTTSGGGAAGHGTVFELSGVNDATYTTLVSFTGANGAAPGADPDAPLMFDRNGNLYGTTFNGGAGGYGTVFELSGPTHSTFTSLVSFTNTTGAAIGAGPTGGLTIDSTGTIIGTTSAGGSGSGTVFTLSGAAHTTFTSLLSFTGNSGSFIGSGPDSTLLPDSSGNLYGVTKTGGNGNGTIYELSGSSHSTFKSLDSFTSNSGLAPGAYPESDLYIDASGNIFGTCAGTGTGASAYGSIFEVSGPTHSTFTTLSTLTGTSGVAPGAGPIGNLVPDAAGNIYGVTAGGGSYVYGGTVFELSGVNHTTFTSIVSFNPIQQGEPTGGLAINSNGDLFGTNGTSAFSIPESNRSTVTRLYPLLTSATSVQQQPPLVDNNGNLLGCADLAGPNDDGIIYELSGPNHNTYAVLLTFTGIAGDTPGRHPGGLIIDSNGNIFGHLGKLSWHWRQRSHLRRRNRSCLWSNLPRWRFKRRHRF
jgi:uncharacterized repeat protein (TIGR03803 family)